MIFQRTPSRCGCVLCDAGCLCGDCAGCTNPMTDRNFMTGVKRAAILGCLILAVGGFLFFAPVVALGSQAAVTTGVFSIKIQTSETSSVALCSITFCYLGQGAVYAQGVYYPVTKSARGLCQLVFLRGDTGRKTLACIQWRVREERGRYLPEVPTIQVSRRY